MKKVLLFSVLGGMFALASCGGGPSAEEQAAAEQAKQDSIKATEQAKLDAMAAEAAAAEEAAAAYDSVADEVTEEVVAKEPENIIEGKVQQTEDAAENIIEGKKGKVETEKASGEDMIQRKKGKAN
jgi:antirestriction protein